MRRIRIKICGLTRAEDVEWATACGVDAVGFVAVPKSRRYVTPEQIAALALLVPPMVARVALFQNADAREVKAVLEQAPIEILQFHGEETSEFCEQFGRPYWKALPCGGVAESALSEHLTQAWLAHPRASAILIDGHAPGALGGSGESVSWANLRVALRTLAQRGLEGDLQPRWILAGGLNPDNVVTAIRESGAHAIDISSGVEAAPGQKAREPLRRLVEAVHCGFDG